MGVFFWDTLYLSCTGKEICTGYYSLREKKNGYKRDTNYSKESIQWLEYLRITLGIDIRHGANSPHGEKRIENYSVDGFCSSNNTIYEYYGCFYHGHCGPNRDKKKWFKTKERERHLSSLGYNIVSITSCKWKKSLASKEEYPVTQTPCTFHDVKDGIMNNESFGFVKCDIHVPDELIPRFSEFPPIFRNTEIPISEIGEHMQAFCRSITRSKGVERSLISSMKGKGIVIMTPLFQKYMELGLVCTDIEWLLEYTPKKVFEWFVNDVTDTRRMADMDSSYKIRGETAKTKGNAAVGITMIDKTRHMSVKHCEQNNVGRHIQNPLFKSLDELNDGIYEIEKNKKKVVHDVPLQIGIAVYSYAKLNLLTFWDFINTYLVNDYYQLMECDTDSLYIAFAKETIDECVKPELKEEWDRVKYNFFSSDSNEPIEFAGKTIPFKQYDKRTPGKYKPEFEGIGMICLNSKVYHCWSDRLDENGEVITKTSCKGVQKKRNELFKQDFLEMIKNPNKEHTVHNAGFIREGTDILTYTQNKKGLNYFYAKRIVLEDGVSTTHLNI